jgi:hypothetical protein
MGDAAIDADVLSRDVTGVVGNAAVLAISTMVPMRRMGNVPATSVRVDGREH